MCPTRNASLPPRHGGAMTPLRLLAACFVIAAPLAALAAEPAPTPTPTPGQAATVPTGEAPEPAATPRPAAVPSAVPGPATPLTLSTTLSRVAAGSKAAADRELDVATAEQKTLAARTELLPSVKLSGSFTASDHAQVAVFGSLSAAMGDQSYLQGRLAARYMLWNGGMRASSIAVARAYESVAGTSGDARVVAAELEGMGAYLEALAAKAQQAEVAKRVEAVEAHLEVVKNMYAQGMVARNDLLETEVRLRTVRDRASALADQETAAVRELKRIMGDDPESQVVLSTALPEPPPIADPRNALVETAVAHSPVVRAAKAELTAATRQEALENVTGRPEVFAEAAHSYAENSHMLYQNTDSIMVGLAWNLYDGGRRASQREQASLATAKARRALEEAEHQVANQVDQAYRDYRQALREAKTAETNVAAAEENLRIEEDQYRAGLAKTTEVLDAEALLAQSRFALIVQHYTAYLKQAQVLALAGRDLVEFYRSATDTTGEGEGS